MSNYQLKWFYLLILSIIWGSSFILIKKGLIGLTDYQLGSLRIVLTSLFLFSVGFKSLKTVKKKHWLWIAISGFTGTFFPSFLFAIAQNHIDSGITSILNSTVPINTLWVGAVLFGIGVTRKQLIGVIIGLLGTLLLIASGIMLMKESGVSDTAYLDQNYWYGGLILFATVGYAFNVNIIKKYLGDISALAVTTGNFLFIIVPAFAILYATGFFDTVFSSSEMQLAVFYVAILSLFGTAIAKVLFNKLVQIASPVFASSVTYTMPIVAVMWGVIDGERFGWMQLVAAAIILVGVYLSNKRIN
ncbi:MAG: EamA family transporter [Bacteroidetes bacterium]|nr:EamA family transporter [Bacteroidota bacterium]